jgi:hypothetical protein
MKDYAKIKALASQILECIGDEPEGGDGTDVKHSEEDRGGPAPAKTGASAPTEIPNPSMHKKRKDDAIALMASTLASKFNK